MIQETGKQFFQRAIGCTVPLFLCASEAFAGNFATCILDRMQGIQNDVAAYSTNKLCTERFPETYYEIGKGSGQGWFAYKTGAECTADKAANTASLIASRNIARACDCLYQTPSYKGEHCANPFDKFFQTR